MSFSGAVKLADLDDFMGPAQDCVKPIMDKAKKEGEEGKKVSLFKESTESNTRIIELNTDTQRPDLIKNKKNAQGEEMKAEVNLVDCLACSGCVTSAESVLIEQQGVAEFLSKLRKSCTSSASISMQSVVSLSVHFQISLEEALGRLVTLLKLVGVRKVYLTIEADSLALEVAFLELQSRLKKEKIFTPIKPESDDNKSAEDKPEELPLPVLGSHCPGFVCYAEKRLPSALLQHISRVRPAQEVQGMLVKVLETSNSVEVMKESLNKALTDYHRNTIRSPLSYVYGLHIHLLQTLNYSSRLLEAATLSQTGSCEERCDDHSDVKKEKDECCTDQKLKDVRLKSVRTISHFHTFIQPCFDKKLEASRPEFVTAEPSDNARLVDSVLATAEIFDLLEEFDLTFNDLPLTVPDYFTCFHGDVNPIVNKETGTMSLAQVTPQAGNGGFSQYMLRRALNLNEWNAISSTTRKNKNFVVHSATTSTHSNPNTSRTNRNTALVVSGFKNIANLVQLLENASPTREKALFAEVLACPSGCLNGAGQAHARLKNKTLDKMNNIMDRLKEAEDKFEVQQWNDSREHVNKLMKKLVDALVASCSSEVPRSVDIDTDKMTYEERVLVLKFFATSYNPLSESESNKFFQSLKW